MQLDTILYERDGQVGIVRLNRPERMNAVNEQMYRDLRAVLSEAGGDRAIRAVVLTGTVRKARGGEKQAFCAGADLKEHAAGSRSASQKRGYIQLAHEITHILFDFPKPTVAAVNGPARGAGAELILNSDFILMAEAATLAFPETGLGTFVGGGATYLLERIAGLAAAKDLICTGRIIDGREAVRLGLALRSVPLASLLPEAMALARELAGKAPLSLALVKKLLHAAPRQGLESALRAETEAILECMETEDWREGVDAFAEKRRPDFKGR